MRQSTKNSRAVGIVGVLLPGEGAQAEIDRQARACDLLEFRADGYSAADIPRALTACVRYHGCTSRNLPLIFTLRLERDGGCWPDADAVSRLPVWQALATWTENEAIAWVDVEVEEIDNLPSALLKDWSDRGIGLLLSHHDLQGKEAPGDWKAVSDKMRRYAPDGVKLALHAGAEENLLAILQLARDIAREFPLSSVFSMGNSGRPTRLLAPFLGCELSYTHLGGTPAAPGQLSALEMRALLESIESGKNRIPDLDNAAGLAIARAHLRRAGFAD